jgi:plasmid maintenance system antidote protein VapI
MTVHAREHDTTQCMTTQNGFRFLASMKKPVRLPNALVALCKTSGDALSAAMGYGGKKPKQVAAELGMRREQLSRILSGQHFFPADKAVAFAYIVGNWGFQQWVAFDAGMDLVPRSESTEERMARLEAENAELRASAA